MSEDLNINKSCLSRSMGNLSNSSSDHSAHNNTSSQQISPIARELGAILKVCTSHHGPLHPRSFLRVLMMAFNDKLSGDKGNHGQDKG